MATTASPIPPAIASDSSGQGDTAWITAVRDGLRDYPEYKLDTWTADGTNGVIAAGAVPIRTQNRPINDGSLLVRDNTAGTNFTVITSGTPTSTQVLANYDTGELVFSAAPASTHVIQASYQYVKWRDQTIEDNLMAGLRVMFPTVGKTFKDESIQIQVLVWDYQLPVWCQDPRSRIMRVRVKDPYIPVEPWRELSGGYERIDLTDIFVPHSQRYSPVARLQVTGWGPYLTLSDLEPQLFQLPVMYALSMLLPKQETYRLRQDTLVPLTQEGGQSPMLLTQSGDYWSRRFNEELQRLGRSMSPGYHLQVRSQYDSRPI